MTGAVEIASEVVAPLREAYRIKEGTDETAMVSAWTRSLARYSVEELRRAVDHMLVTRKVRQFPTVAEVHEAIADSMPRWAAGRAPWVDWEARALADPMARMAARDGWICELVHYCMTHKEIPDGVAVGHMKATLRPFLEELVLIRDGRPPYQAFGGRSAFLSLARKIIQRGVDYAERIGERSTLYHRALARFDAAMPDLRDAGEISEAATQAVTASEEIERVV